MVIETSSLFLKIKEIPSSDTFFRELEQKYRLKYHYFQIYSTYYLFLVEMGNSAGVLSFCYEKLQILEELNKKQRKLRSLRGFLLYVLEILEMKGEENITVLKTNFPPLFWKRVKDMIRQSKKRGIIELLFETSNSSRKSFNTGVEDELKNLQNEVNLLKNKIEKLETYIKSGTPTPV
jgi:hypothetical protein